MEFVDQTLDAAPVAPSRAPTSATVVGARRLDDLERLVGGGWWEWEVQSGRTTWSDAFAALAGLPAGADRSLASLLRAVEPDDRDAVVGAFRAAFAGPDAFEVTHRMASPDAPGRWLRTRGVVRRDATGVPALVRGWSVEAGGDPTPAAAVLAAALVPGDGGHDATATALRRAVADGELVLHFQPIVDLCAGTTVGHEALLRWQHPQLGLLGPADFIGAAERSGAIAPVGEWVLQQACRAAVALQQVADEPLVMSVNVSPSQFHHHDVAAVVASALADSGLPPAQLHVEITESVLARRPAAVYALEGLRGLGVTLSIDDFGTGYSSLASLKHVPVGELKIDKSLVDDLGRSRADAAILEAAVAMAAALGLSTVAEGVETVAQRDHLRKLGVARAQGFLFGPPVPTEIAAAALRA